MTVINTNTKALFSQQALKVSGRELTKAMQQLSTGKRINTAGDDAAGMAIATRMTQQIRALDQAFRNAGDAISLIQTAEGATNEITDMLQRMRELAIQAINDTNNNEQRSYLDLEFQQLKQEIVRISDMTEWNGFKILNGSTGVPVGERPVYKTTSNDDFSTVFIDPTTVRLLGGRDLGIIEDISLEAESASDGDTWTITLQDADASTGSGRAEIEVRFSDEDGDGDVDDEEVADQIASALQNDERFNSSSGRTVTVIDGSGGRPTTVRVSYNSEETEDLVSLAQDTNGQDDVLQDLIDVGHGTVTRSQAIDVSSAAAEVFDLNGEFLKAGSLSISLDGTESDGDTVYATFLTNRGEEITMTGVLTLDTGAPETSIQFLASGDNSKVISTPLNYTFKYLVTNPNDGNGYAVGSAQDIDLTGRAFSVAVDVEGNIPALRSDDLHINGVNIGASYPEDDLLSPANNAAGSAIAIAAAINRKTSETGVSAVVNPNLMDGTAMVPAAVVSGKVRINGYTSPEIQTVLNNTAASRRAVVEAINFISDLTGVTAVDTGIDSLGIQLQAPDGRNIEIQFLDLDTTASNFALRTGLKAGIQAGTYGLESRVEAPILVETTATGDIERARLALGNFSENVSKVITAPRAVVTSADDVKDLSAGDLMINGIAIPAAVSGDDDVSDTTADTSTRAASAIAMAAAINKMTGQTGVEAEAYPARLEGTTASRSVTSGSHSLYVNGIEIEIDFTVGSTAGERVDEVIAQINVQTGVHGVHASKTDLGGLALETVDGRNLSVWFDPELNVSSEPTITASEFGLGSPNPSGSVAAYDLTNATPTDGYNAYATVYGRVSLIFSKLQAADFPTGASVPFLGKAGPAPFRPTDPPVPGPAIVIRAGVDGYNSDSNFLDLGFQVGEFGGEVDESVSKMTPPRTGRLSFQVGATSGQIITIDLADFGAGGPITSSITGDVFDVTQVNKIDTREDANSVLSKLDSVMDNVNATRAVMGAVMNRLTHAMDNLSNASMNQSASRSQIEDADYAKASTELAKTQIMQQAGTAILAQANASQQLVMQLLRG